MVPAVLAAARVGITALLRELIKQIAQNIVKQLGRIRRPSRRAAGRPGEGGGFAGVAAGQVPAGGGRRSARA
ncbi:hypothetical protein [Saccharopolyspora gregorii]|uniref:Uncharacterized protein n=1 Tax=Saccharopolyspora gregorii TaxID=33914 RepID=A0ABP6S386_9PSEU